MKSLICPLCQNAFETKNPLRKYCSESCSAAARAQKIRTMASLVIQELAKTKKQRTCVACGSAFQGKAAQKYCSPACAANAFEVNRKKRLASLRAVRSSGLADRRCTECREAFSPRQKTQRFCSTECSKFYWQQQTLAREIDWRLE